MNDKNIDEFANALEKEIEPIANEFAKEVADSVVKRVEPAARIFSLLVMVGFLIFIIVSWLRGSLQGRLVILPFVETPDSIAPFIVVAVLAIVTIWHLVSVIHFFIKRRNAKM